MKNYVRKTLSWVLIFTLIFGQLSAPALVLAQEATASAETQEATNSAQPIETTSPTPTATPSASPDIATTQTFSLPNTERDQNKPTSTKKSGVQTKRINTQRKYVEGEVLVKLKESAVDLKTNRGFEKVEALEVRHNVETTDEIKESNIAIVESNKTTQQLVSELRGDPIVEKVEPNYVLELTSITNDPDFDLLWGLDNKGNNAPGNSGVADADIDAPEAWDKESESQPDVLVAVIDTGVAYNHPDLTSNMWDGSNCKDDNNLLIPGGCPNHGWDYAASDNDPEDEYGHGTHVAGTIAGAANNSQGITGISSKNNLKIMAIRGGAYYFYVEDVIRSINFAKYNGAKVINASFGGSGWYSDLMKEAIASFPGLFVAAAGNNYSNNDQNPFYPASYDLANVISVAATDSYDHKAYFSNYGATTVDVGAPGQDIYSTYPSGGDNFVETYSEDFDSTTPPTIPSGYTKTGDWGTKIESGVVLYGDVNQPYKPNSNNTISSPSIDLSNASSASIGFRTRCDTQYEFDYTDYLTLEYSGNGQNFNYATKWDEYDIDSWNGDFIHDTHGYAEAYIEFDIPAQYLTSAFKFQYRWVSNDSVTGDLGLGCFVDDISISKSNDFSYTYMSGTSMASPHVAGMAGLLFSYKPNLSPARVKEIILDSGDYDADLAGKTVSGKRVNLNNALMQAVSNNANLSSLTLDKATLSPDFSENIASYSATVAYSVKDIKVTPTALDSASTIKINNKTVQSGQFSEDIALNPGTNLITILVTAENGATKTYIISIERLNDTLAPTITISKSPNKLNSNTNFTMTVNFDDSVTKEYKLDSTVWTLYTGPVTVSQEGFHTFDARGTDEAGNTGFAYTTLIIDKTAPIIEKIEDGKYYNTNVSPTFSDAAATLNGKSFVSGTEISEDGTYTLVVTDEAENVSQVSFTIDKTPPVLSIIRIPDTNVANTNYTLAIDYSDIHLSTKEYRLDSGNWIDYQDQIIVTTEGFHIFEARLTDAAGNITQKQTSFKINKTVPTAANDSYSTIKNTPITIDSSGLLANDKDSGEDTLSVTGYANAVNGQALVSGTGVTFFPADDFMGTGSFNYTVSDGLNTTQGTVYVVVTPVINNNQIPIQPIVNLNKDNNQIVVVNTFFDAVINVPNSVTDAFLNLSNLTSTSGSQTSATINNKININADTSIGNINVSLPDGLTLSTTSTWDGTVKVPTILENSTVSTTPSAGMESTTTSVVEIGFGDTKLTLSKAVRILIPGKANQFAAYSQAGQITPITTICTSDNQSSADALPDSGDCKIDSGSDLVIWTKHFTKFITYTENSQGDSNNPLPGSSNSAGSSNASNYNSNTPCTDTKPGSVPKLLSALVSGKNEITLTWSKASDPVSYYLIAYGVQSGKPLYGNPNAGDKNTTSYTVKGLTGGVTYYFVVRAGNNCMPGEFSNEVKVVTSGNKNINQVATNFKQGVLSAKNTIDNNSNQLTNKYTNSNVVINTFNALKDFILNFFKFGK